MSGYWALKVFFVSLSGSDYKTRFLILFRTSKYLKGAASTRVCAIGGFFISIPLFLTGKHLCHTKWSNFSLLQIDKFRVCALSTIITSYSWIVKYQALSILVWFDFFRIAGFAVLHNEFCHLMLDLQLFSKNIANSFCTSYLKFGDLCVVFESKWPS